MTDIKVQLATATTAAIASPVGEGTVRNQPSQPTYQPPSAPVGRGGLQTVLKEQLLSVTVKIMVVKLLPGI
jgi:hypothetical protein